jgi:hypothetical protein
MSWYNTFNDMFFIAIGGAVVGLVGLCVKACVKCKWVEFDGCGIRIRRKPELENDDVIPSPSPQLSRKHSNAF